MESLKLKEESVCRKRKLSDLDSAEILSMMRKKGTTGGFGKTLGHRRQTSSLKNSVFCEEMERANTSHSRSSRELGW